MLLFQWNSLRPGDAVTIHDDTDLAAPMHDGIVSIVQTRLDPGGNDIAIRRADGMLVRPRRGAVHTTGTGMGDCWRCDLSTAKRAAELAPADVTA